MENQEKNSHERIENDLKRVKQDILSLKEQMVAKNKNYKWFAIISGIITISIAIVWIIYICRFDGLTGCKRHLSYNFLLTAFSHLAFLSMFIGGIFITYKIYCAQQSNAEKDDDFKRKREWEQFQYDLNKAEREFRQSMEVEKWKNDNERFHFELNKEREDVETIKKLKGEKWALETELKKYTDASIGEGEKNAQVFHLLALALSDQNIFSENKTIEEKLKQIEKDYELLKKTITDIKL